MANLHLVTGYAGREHVTAADQGAFNVALLGSGQFVMNKGNKLAASIVSNNQIRIADGDIYMQGRFIRLNEGSYADLTIENGTQGMLRNDLIVARYTKDVETGIEEVNLVVIKGTATASNPSDPGYTSGNIIEGNAYLNDMPLYRVVINGLTVESAVKLFSVKDMQIPTIVDLGLVTEAELETKLTQLLVGMGNSEAKQFCASGFVTSDWRWFGTLYKSSNNFSSCLMQGAYLDGTIIQKKYGGKWNPIEWVNPPMYPGTEYRTVERSEGKAVYAKRVSYKLTESVSGQMTLEIPHGISGFKSLVRWSGKANAYTLPYMGTDTYCGIGQVTSTNIQFNNHGSTWNTNYTFIFDLYYTKS